MHLLVYLLYRLVRTFFSVVGAIYWLALRTVSLADGNSRPVQISTIVFRAKHDVEDLSRDCDFICLPHSTAPLDELRGDCWSLFYLTRRRAYFVRLSQPFEQYNAVKAPFFYAKQYTDAEQLASVPIADFLRLGESVGQQQRDTVLFTNTARCGSTLLAQMLHFDEHTFVLAEPYIMRHLSICFNEGTFSEERMGAIVRSSFALLAKNVPPSTCFVLKTSSHEVRLVPLVRRLLPRVRHFFMFRERALASVVRMASRSPIYKHALLIDKLPRFFGWVNGLILSEAPLIRRFRPRNLTELGAIYYASPLAQYRQNEHCFDIPMLLYADLMQRPAHVLAQVFPLCRIPEHKMDEAIGRLAKDSQADTHLSQKNMQRIGFGPVDEQQLSRLQKLATLLDLSHDYFAVNLQ